MATIGLNTSPLRGRYLTALNDIAEGSEVVVAATFAAAPVDSSKKKVCATCLDQAAKAHALRCVDCDQVFFCSKDCLDECMAGGHDLVCKAFRRLATSKASLHEKSVMKLVLNILLGRWKQRKNPGIDSRAAFAYIPSINEVLQQSDSGSNTITTTIEIHDPLTPTPPTYKDVTNLQSHYHEWTEDVKREWKKIHSLVVAMLMESRELVDDDLIHESEGDDLDQVVMHLVSKIESNGFGIWALKRKPVADPLTASAADLDGTTICSPASNCLEENDTDRSPNSTSNEEYGTGACIGRALYPHASFFNHSCIPTCEPIQYQTKLIFKARHRIEAGQELTISYIDTNSPYAGRKSSLLQDYFFECKCMRCEADACAKPNQREKVVFSGNQKGGGKKPKEKQPKKKKVEAKGYVYE
ncbi:UNVERIFIED_CONTAM: hypothetical protein HDU68_005283 [Siphonaria sp. JEL0065]|nr:hypothetical protein HDU68_005283 [Siphonaria sp. JEL0065]